MTTFDLSGILTQIQSINNSAAATVAMSLRNALNPVGLSAGETIRWNGTSWDNVATPIITGTTGASGPTGIFVGTETIDVSGTIRTTNTTNSTSSTTGALTTSGGLGVALNTFLGGILNATGAVNTTNATASSSTSTGAIVAGGGLGVAGAAFGGSSLIVGGIYRNPGQHMIVASSSNAVSQSITTGTLTTLNIWDTIETNVGFTVPVSGVFTLPSSFITSSPTGDAVNFMVSYSFSTPVIGSYHAFYIRVTNVDVSITPSHPIYTKVQNPPAATVNDVYIESGVFMFTVPATATSPSIFTLDVQFRQQTGSNVNMGGSHSSPWRLAIQRM
jgi:hypothetical protein